MQAGPTRAPTPEKEKQPSTIRKFLASIWKRLKSAWASFTGLFSTLFGKKDSAQEQTTANQEPVRAQEGPSGRQEAPESVFSKLIEEAKPLIEEAQTYREGENAKYLTPVMRGVLKGFIDNIEFYKGNVATTQNITTHIERIRGYIIELRKENAVAKVEIQNKKEEEARQADLRKERAKDPALADEGAREKQLTESQERHLDSLEEQGKEAARRALAKANEEAQTQIQQAETYCNDKNSPVDTTIISKMKVFIGQITNRNQKDAQKITEWTEELRQENEKAKVAQAAKKEEPAKTEQFSDLPSPNLVASVSPITQPIVASTSETPVTQPSKIEAPIDPKETIAAQKEKEEAEKRAQEQQEQEEAAERLLKIEKWKEKVSQNPSVLDNHDKKGRTPLMRAIKYKELDLVKCILALHNGKESEGAFLKGLFAQLDSYDKATKGSDSSPLIWAAKTNNLGIIKELLRSLLKTPKGSIFYLISMPDIKAIYLYKNPKGESFSTLFNANHPDKEALKTADPELAELLDRVDCIASISFEKAETPTPLPLSTMSMSMPPAPTVVTTPTTTIAAPEAEKPTPDQPIAELRKKFEAAKTAVLPSLYKSPPTSAEIVEDAGNLIPEIFKDAQPSGIARSRKDKLNLISIDQLEKAFDLLKNTKLSVEQQVILQNKMRNPIFYLKGQLLSDQPKQLDQYRTSVFDLYQDIEKILAEQPSSSPSSMKTGLK